LKSSTGNDADMLGKHCRCSSKAHQLGVCQF